MITELSGWAGTPASHADVSWVTDPAHVRLDDAQRGHLVRGAGRSYGDAALNAGGRIWRCRPADVTRLDISEDGVVDAPAHLTIAELAEYGLSRGWFVPVTPGTKHVTLGGAFAADVHGKNHHRDGSFADHVESIDLMLPDLTRVSVKQGDPLFQASAGGMGLIAVIERVRLQMMPVSSTSMTVNTFRAQSLDETISLMARLDAQHRYAVAWLDMSVPGPASGRGILSVGDHAPRETGTPTPRSSPRLTIPPIPFPPLVNPTTIRAFNELWWRRAPLERLAETQSIDRFFYPLDSVGGWNRLYGGAGLIQYQFVVPEHEVDTIGRVLIALRGAGASSFLTVLKRFGPGRDLLSFPTPGWTLAVDIPAGLPGLDTTLREVDQTVVDAGGRFYLAKDSRMSRDTFEAGYPELDRWKVIKRQTDPDGVLVSDLARRLGLVSHA